MMDSSSCFKIEPKKKYIISKKSVGEQNFDILSNSKEIASREIELVDENFLSSKNVNESQYTNKHVFIFDIGGKNLIQFPNEGIFLEINKKAPNENKDETNVSNEEKNRRIKNLIQLYIEEKELDKLFEQKIKSKEKDLKEYYLINKNWIRFYEEKSNYEKIKEKLDIIDEKDLKLEKILNTKIFGEISSEIKVKALPEKIRKEENFHLQKNQNKFYNIKESKDLFSPHEFTLVSEDLFNSLYKEIKNQNKYNKEEYKFKTLIGDNVLFIQDKKNDNIFYAYTKDKKNRIELLSYLFKYNDKKIFFDDIENIIQNNGFNNYLLKKNINFHNIHNKKLDKLLTTNKENIGEYINYNTIYTNTYKKMEIKNTLHKSSILYPKYNEFINDKILKFNKNMNLEAAIKEIIEKKNLKNYIEVIAIEFDKLEKKFYFPQVKELLNLKNKKEDQKAKLENIVNKLLENKNPHKNDSQDDINIKPILPNEFSQNNVYTFINKDLLALIDNSINLNSLPQLYYFVSNNTKYIFYSNQDEQKLYKVVEFDNSNNCFKLKDEKLKLQELNLGYKEIVEKLKELNKIETKIEKLIKSTVLKQISNSDTYYLVNKKWMKEFKTFYDYDNIIKNKSNNSSKNQKFPDKLNNIDYLNTELDKNICNNVYVPNNFEIFDKKNFDLLIKEINTKNKLKLEFKYCFNIYLGDNTNRGY